VCFDVCWAQKAEDTAARHSAACEHLLWWSAYMMHWPAFDFQDMQPGHLGQHSVAWFGVLHASPTSTAHHTLAARCLLISAS
jgi:hypothetical protein